MGTSYRKEQCTVLCKSFEPLLISSYFASKELEQITYPGLLKICQKVFDISCVFTHF